MERYYRSTLLKVFVKVMIYFQIFAFICGIMLVIGFCSELFYGYLSKLEGTRCDFSDRFGSIVGIVIFVVMTILCGMNIPNLAKAKKDIYSEKKDTSGNNFFSIFLSMVYFILIAFPFLCMLYYIDGHLPKFIETTLRVIVIINIAIASIIIWRKVRK